MPTENVYKVVSEEIEINGAKLEHGAFIKLNDEQATEIIDHLELASAEEVAAYEAANAPKEDAPKAAPAEDGSQAAAQGSGAAAATPAKPSETSEEPKKPGFVGGHTVGGNEKNPHKGGSLRTSGLTPKKQ